MKNTFKKLLSLVLVILLLIPISIIPSYALEADESLLSNWNVMAVKFNTGTYTPIAPMKEGYQPRTQGFAFNETVDGGIKVTTSTYDDLKGGYGCSAVTSNATTKLDGLSVAITPDEFDSINDAYAGNSISIIWSEEKIEYITKYNEESKKFTGVIHASEVYSNGLRHAIPTVSDAVSRTPAYKVPELANGKALFIRVALNCPYGENADPVASYIAIVYYDGYYIGDDGHPGYRWTFEPVNHEHTPIGNNTPISRGNEVIDLSDGLFVNVRADERLGYIVNVNGYDYYRGDEVAYFPDANTEWEGYGTEDITSDAVKNLEEVWTTSMAYAREDIDLTGLREADEGYLTIGASSIDDKNKPDHRCNYTIDKINGIPAADWAGEATPDHECSFELVETVPPTCVRDGYDYYRCTLCGVAKNDNIVPAVGHTPKADLTTLIKPTCTAEGWQVRICYVCRARLDNYYPLHTYEWVVKKEVTCGFAGIETEVCTGCGIEGETRKIPMDAEAHISDTWIPIVTEGVWTGLENGVCRICGEEAEHTVDVFEYIKHFTDVKKGAWYEDEVAYCVKLGYVSGMSEDKFAPGNNLTRAQFLVLLAKVNGADLSAYEGKDSGFEDVRPNHWFNSYVCWAVENGITSGISETKFAPNNNVTRAQLARFFYVYTELTGGNIEGASDITAYPDAAKVPVWAKTPVEWAVNAGLIAGVNKEGTAYLDPNGNATRAQAARMIMIYTNLTD